MSSKSVDSVLRNFCEFLNASYASRVMAQRWASERPGMSAFEFHGDWAEANWELMVEQSLCDHGQFLRPYGSGSDGYDERDDNGGRVFFTDQSPTHEIRVAWKEGASPLNFASQTVTKEIQALRLGRFWGEVPATPTSRASYEDCPPFTLVELFEPENESDLLMLRIADVQFLKRPV